MEKIVLLSVIIRLDLTILVWGKFVGHRNYRHTYQDFYLYQFYSILLRRFIPRINNISRGAPVMFDTKNSKKTNYI